MDEAVYDIFITGTLKDGVDAATAAANLARLFKIGEQKATALVDGRPHCLKKGADRETAQRYLAALQRAGFETAGKKRDTKPSTEMRATPAAGAFSLAPAGAPVLREEERAKVPELDIDTSQFRLASPFSEPAGGERERAEIQAPEFGLAPPGSDLEELPRFERPLDPDTSGLSLAEPGEDLAPAAKKPPPQPPSTDHLKLVED